MSNPSADGTVASTHPSTTPALPNTTVHITDTAPRWHTVPDDNTLSHDFELNMDTEYIPSLLHHDTPSRNTTPLTNFFVGTTQTAQAKPTTPLEKDIINYEIWHQRLAHVSEHKLRKTQQCAHGIPPFTTTTLPNLVRCRICDIARLQKAPRGPPQIDPPDLQPGQMFQIDIGFFRGPENLADVVDRKAEPSMKVIESRQGYVCYLLIIDRKTRKVWIFPLKSRAVPMTLISTFLRLHGNHDSNLPRWIRTDGEGALAHSAIFRSDILTEFGYLIELTATDASSQNALAERPHKTFGLMVRCLLYSSRLPVMFWADAYVYANYIYDRLYHSAIGKTPYEAWTNKQPSLQHIRAFGAHVLVKRSGHRPTKADPHFYDGYFLRFAATSKNIIYWDPITKREKLARHCVLDEFHFGSEYSARPPGATQVLQTLLPTLTTANRLPSSSSNIIVEDLPSTTTGPTMQTDILTRDQRCIPLPTHEATIAKHTAAVTTLFANLTPTQQLLEEIANLQTSETIYTTPTRLTLPLNRLPTLGLILIDDAQLHHPVLHSCQEGTAASRIPRWRSTLRHSLLYSIQQHKIATRQDASNRPYPHTTQFLSTAYTPGNCLCPPGHHVH